jgi:ABC-type antimicrobial peptide transport system permease subunit
MEAQLMTDRQIPDFVKQVYRQIVEAVKTDNLIVAKLHSRKQKKDLYFLAVFDPHIEQNVLSVAHILVGGVATPITPEVATNYYTSNDLLEKLQ